MKINVPYTGAESFKWLKENKAALIDMKKSETKNADAFLCGPGYSSTVKSVGTSGHLYANDFDKGILKRAIVVNTFNWLDSHGDVHLNGLFSKSIAERGKRILHLYDHKRELIGSKVGEPISWSEKLIRWSELGVSKDGMTGTLYLESEIRKDMNKDVYDKYAADEVDQHSVGMQYVRVDLAVNAPGDKWYEDEYKVWLEVFPLIGNPEKAEGVGYFWAVREAKAIEGSAVLLGSNELTPTLGKEFAPPLGTQIKNVTPTKSLDMDKLLKSYN